MKVRGILLLYFFLLVLSGCKVGEDDPFISLRSRDNRLKGNWKLKEMKNRYDVRIFNPGNPARTAVVTSEFDGYNTRVITTVNDLPAGDTTFGFNYLMNLKDDGKLHYESTLIQYGVGIKSSGDEAWYWLQTDKKKERVYLGDAMQMPLVTGVALFSAGTNLNTSNFARDLNVDGLRNKELKLSYDKTLNQSNPDGSFQQVVLSSKLTFVAK